MEIRPARADDIAQITEIDGTIESTSYLHLDRTVDDAGGFVWKAESRPLREKLIAAAPLHDDDAFLAKQVATGAEEGLVLVADHGGLPAALLMATVDHRHAVARLHDLRVDFDLRREGLATVLLFKCIEWARTQDVRAVAVETLANNVPAAALLRKTGFDLSGIDVRRRSNHDLVKESATLLWYLELR